MRGRQFLVQAREFKPTITLCYEFLNHILELLPTEMTPDRITRADAAVGQFLWVALQEVGHATFAMFDVPILGSAEDAADNFATYIILQFGEESSTSIDSWSCVGRGELTWETTKEIRLYRYGPAPRTLLQSVVLGRWRSTAGVRRPGSLFTGEHGPRIAS